MSRAVLPPLLFVIAALLFSLGALGSLRPRHAISAASVATATQEPTLVPRPTVARPRALARTAVTPADQVPALTTSRTGAVIAGLVRGEDGAVPAHAAVIAYALTGPLVGDDDSDQLLHGYGVDADGEGHFELAVPPGDYAIHAYAGQRASTLIRPVAMKPGERKDGVTFVLSGPSELEVRVVGSDGKEVVADLLVRLPGQQRPIARRRCLAGVGAIIPALPHGPLELEAVGRDGARARLSLSRPEHGLVLRLGDGLGELTLALTDEAGAPVENALVSLSTGHAGFMSYTDERGEVTLRPPARRVHVEASVGSTSIDPIDLEVDERARTVPLRLVRRAAARGRVRAAGDEPARGGMRAVRLDGPMPGETAMNVELEDDGSYRFEPLPAGRYELVYVQPDGAPAGDGSALTVSLRSGDDTTMPDLRLPAARRLRGRVVDERGEPVADAEISLVDARDGSFTSQGVHSDGAGRFELAVAGPVRLRAEGEGSSSAMFVARGQGDEDVELVVAGTGSLQGVVRTKGGRARVRCTDGLWHDVDASGQYQLNCPTGSSLEVDADGERKRFPVEIEEGEETYAELRL